MAETPIVPGPSSDKRPIGRCYIGRYSTKELAERISASYGDSAYPNRSVEPEQVGNRTDWLIWCDDVRHTYG